jgi:hypothetical protein
LGLKIVISPSQFEEYISVFNVCLKTIKGRERLFEGQAEGRGGKPVGFSAGTVQERLGLSCIYCSGASTTLVFSVVKRGGKYYITQKIIMGQ